MLFFTEICVNVHGGVSRVARRVGKKTDLVRLQLNYRSMLGSHLVIKAASEFFSVIVIYFYSLKKLLLFFVCFVDFNYGLSYSRPRDELK